MGSRCYCSCPSSLSVICLRVIPYGSYKPVDASIVIDVSEVTLALLVSVAGPVLLGLLSPYF
jgi:hypothetical protein